MGIFYLFFGVGAVLGLLWVFFRWGIPLIAYIIKTIIDVTYLWTSVLIHGKDPRKTKTE